MKEASSDVIEVRLVSGQNGLEVLWNQKTLSFTEQSWMDLQGGTLIHFTAYDEFIDCTSPDICFVKCTFNSCKSINWDIVIGSVTL